MSVGDKISAEGKMRVAFWGLGSIAKRHIRNLVAVLNQRKIDCEIDVYRHKVGDASSVMKELPVSHVYAQADIAFRQYDIIFITCPTSMHYDAIKVCAMHATHLFIEKPVFSDPEADLKGLNLKEGSIYYVACPLRYTSVIQYLKNNIDADKVFSVRAISSSYLPDWRLGQDYRETYSAYKSLGGGVCIDLIHEWDYLTVLFGMPEKVTYAGGKFSNLEIDSDDLATYIGVYSNRLVELHLDYFGRKTIRECQLYLPDETIKADIAEGEIEFLKSGRHIELHEERDTYQKRELEHFVDMVEGKCENDSTIQHAVNVLKIAENRWRTS